MAAGRFLISAAAKKFPGFVVRFRRRLLGSSIEGMTEEKAGNAGQERAVSQYSAVEN
jgi:hypothetical protein